jgi:hypothetical protein
MATSPNEVEFVKGVAQSTGLDPDVLYAWIASEGHPGDLYNNYLNIASATARSLGEPTVGTAAASTAEFGSVQVGIDATVKEIRSLGIDKAAGQAPSGQINQIAASPWASSHYGGPGGPNLANVFRSMFPGRFGVAEPSIVNPPGPSITDVGANIKTGAGDVASAAGNVLGFPERAFQFLTSWRFAEIVGGFLLLIVGLILLGRQFGLSMPRTPFDRYASAQPTSREGTPRRTTSYTLEADRPAPRRAPARSAVDYGEVPF